MVKTEEQTLLRTKKTVTRTKTIDEKGLKLDDIESSASEYS